MIREAYIYVWFDPRDPEHIRYVGKTIDYKDRTRAEIYEAKKKLYKNYRASWIQSLLNINIKPEYKIIEICNIEDYSQKEVYWIKHYRDLGHKLTNMTDGGEGIVGFKMSQETITRRTAKVLGSKRSSEVRNNISQGHKNAIPTQKMSTKKLVRALSFIKKMTRILNNHIKREQNKIKWQEKKNSPEYREKLCKLRKEYWNTEKGLEQRKICAERQRNNFEHLAKMQKKAWKANTGRFVSIQTRMNISNGLKGVKWSEEAKKKHSETIKLLWERKKQQAINEAS